MATTRLHSKKQNPLSKQTDNVRTVAGFLISAFFLWLTFRAIDFSGFKIIPHTQSLLFLFAAMLVLLFSVWLQSLRMKLFWSKPPPSSPTVSTLPSLILGNLYNSIIPGNLGEAIKAWHLSRKNNLPFGNTIAALITEKWLDAHLFLFLSVLYFLYQPFQPHFIHYSVATVAFMVLGLSVVYSLMKKIKWVEKKIWSIALLYKKIGIPLFRTYLQVGYFQKHLRQQKTLLRFVLIGIGVFTLNVLQYYLLFKAVALHLPIANVSSAYLISLSMVVIIAIPSAPGNIGVLHYGVYASLLFAAHNLGIAPNTALLQTFVLYTIYLHCSCFIPEVIIGLVVLLKERNTLFQNR